MKISVPDGFQIVIDFLSWVLFLLTWINLNHNMDSNYIHNKVWGEITY